MNEQMTRQVDPRILSLETQLNAAVRALRLISQSQSSNFTSEYVSRIAAITLLRIGEQ